MLDPVERRPRRWGEWIAWVVLFGVACTPLLVTYDLPLVDIPAHLANLSIWSHHGNPVYGLDRWYSIHLGPVPYWGYYGVVHALNWFVPLRVANKIFVALTIAGFALGLRALLVAHRRPPILALAAFALVWTYCMAWGFLAYLAGVGPLLWAYSLLARLADARPWPSRRLVVTTLVVGPLLYFIHPLILLLWLPAILLYLPDWRSLVAAPAVLLFIWGYRQSHKPTKDPITRFQALWHPLHETLRNVWTGDLWAFVTTARHDLILAALLLGFGLAFVLVDRAEGPRDRRPLLLAGLLLGCSVFLPLDIEKPVGFAILSSRVPIVLGLALFACAPQGTLSRRRAAAVVAPLAFATVVHTASIVPRFANFDRHERDFYAVIDKLPYNPSVLTLVYQTHEPDIGSAWQKFASYVQIERGGWNASLWDSTQGIGEAGFRVERRSDIPTPPAPALDRPTDFTWDKFGAAYEWFLTKDEPRNVFSTRAELQLVAASGPWKLWHKQGPSVPAPGPPVPAPK